MADIVGVGFDWKDSPELVMEGVNDALKKKGLKVQFVRMDDECGDDSAYALVAEDETVPTQTDFWGSDDEQD